MDIQGKMETFGIKGWGLNEFRVGCEWIDLCGRHLAGSAKGMLCFQGGD